jgi:hypothetical protein
VSVGIVGHDQKFRNLKPEELRAYIAEEVNEAMEIA